ncbi:hypothetical protein AVEN_82959-1 [Araneus ventricosus]|uniref:Uncharacterized protein n=1 Tax=Araneus ventricosus TaxID=182803 RepID=A0A4Y2I308_ARAVE|nr:hypothetical protein AVEN_82959-1 [Araneus ventricosus]
MLKEGREEIDNVFLPGGLQVHRVFPTLERLCILNGCMNIKQSANNITEMSYYSTSIADLKGTKLETLDAVKSKEADGEEEAFRK